MANPTWFKAFGKGSAHAKPGNYQSSRGMGRGGPPSGVNNPQCNPRSLAFTKKFALQKIIARYVPAGGGGDATNTFNPIANVYNPSNRLRCMVTIALEPDNQSSGDPTFIGTAPTWSVRPVNRNPETGRETPLQVVYPPSGVTANIPDSYEFDTNNTEHRITVIGLTHTNLAASYVPAAQNCNILISVQWEPNIEMSKEERDMLYAACQLSYGAPILIQNDAT